MPSATEGSHYPAIEAPCLNCDGCLLPAGWLRHSYVHNRVAFILRLVPCRPAVVISVAGIWVRRAAARQTIIGRADGRSGHARYRANRNAGRDRVIIPAAPAASPAAVTIAVIAAVDIDVASVDVAVVDIIAAARPLTWPASSAYATNSTDTANAAGTSCAADTPNTTDAASAARASCAADTTDAADPAGRPAPPTPPAPPGRPAGI